MPNITNAVFEFDNNYVYSNKIVRIIRIPAHVYPEKYCCVHDLYMTACDVMQLFFKTYSLAVDVFLSPTKPSPVDWGSHT